MKLHTIIGCIILMAITCIVACKKFEIRFPDKDAGQSTDVPNIKNDTARYLWNGPDYYLSVKADLSDVNGLQSIQLINKEWNFDSTIMLGDRKEFLLRAMFNVPKDANKTIHKLDVIVKNVKGGVLNTTIAIADSSDNNQDPTYDPDNTVPTIIPRTPTSPAPYNEAPFTTALKAYYGLDGNNISFNIAVNVTDDRALAKVTLKVWGETYLNEAPPVLVEDVRTPGDDERKDYLLQKDNISLPPYSGEYAILITATDTSGNENTFYYPITVGVMNRLYLSDAKNALEITNQAFDGYAAASAWGMGTIIPMKKIATNKFQLLYYYANAGDDNIRFYAYQASDKPFNNRTILYNLSGSQTASSGAVANVLGVSSSDNKKVTVNPAETNYKLTGLQKGYYTLTVDMSTRTIIADPYTPANSDWSNASKFPGFSPSAPYDYLAIIAGGAIVNSRGWAEDAASPPYARLTREPDSYIYSGSFTTAANGQFNMRAPMASLGGADVGWIRLPTSNRNLYTDVYGDLMSGIMPVGPGSGYVWAPAGNYGVWLNAGANKDYIASYDLVTYRLRMVRLN